ncbi:hypothetical protein ACHAXT_007368 [Thalassiosira profunda]
MTSTTAPDDAAAVNVDSNLYDLRDDGDRSDRSASTFGATILSSRQPSSPPPSARHDERIHVPLGSLSLSLNPSMVDSSVLLPEQRMEGSWVGLHEHSDASSVPSSLSSSDISSISSAGASRSESRPTFIFDTDLLANVGRSLVLASVASDGDVSSDSESEAPLPKQHAAKGQSAREGKWFDQLRTEEDWERFRSRANEHLNALVEEEMRGQMNHSERGASKGSVKKLPAIKECAPRNNEGFLTSWWQGLHEAFTGTAPGGASEPVSESMRRLTSLVKEFAEIKQQLESLPPIPPTLPEDLPLEDLPEDRRDSMRQYRDRLSAWRGEAMPQREALHAKYAECHEKVLAAIIDREEELFHRRSQGARLRSDFGALNDDGYIEVAERRAPVWDSVENVLVKRSKCQTTLIEVLVAALTVGAGFFVAMQSKRSRQ